MRTSSHGRWTLLLGVAVALLGVSCQDDDLIAPDPAERHGSHVPPPPDISGSYGIPVPPNNTTNFGHTSWRSTGVEIPEPAWVHVRVEGGVTLSANPIYTMFYCSTCATRAGDTYGPLGSGRWLAVHVRIRRADGSTRSVRLRSVEGESLAAEALVRVTATPATFEVERTGIPGGGSCSFNRPPGYTKPGPCPDPPSPFGADHHHTGAYLLSGSQTLTAEAVGPVEVHARRTRVTPGDTVTFDATISGGDVSTIRWLYEPGDTAADPAWDYGSIWHDFPPCRDKRVCVYPPEASGRMYVVARVSRVYVHGVSQIVRVGEAVCTPEDDEVTIVEAAGPNPERSFTTAPDEATIELRASVSPDCEDLEVQWEVEDAPDDDITSPTIGHVPAGEESEFTVPTPTNRDWPAEHGQLLDRKALAYRARAYVAADDGRIDSEWRTVRQSEADVIRQEYIEFELDEMPRPSGDLERRPHLPVVYGTEPVYGDYDYPAGVGLSWARRSLRDLVSEIDQSWTTLLQANSVYRNPVHHHRHLRLGNNSPHMYGKAVDFQTFPADPGTPAEVQGQHLYWTALRAIGLSVEGTCAEPLEASGVGHVHFDVRPEAECPAAWSR